MALGELLTIFFVILQTGHLEEEYCIPEIWTTGRHQTTPHYSKSFTQEQCQSVRLFVAFLSEVLKCKADGSHGSQREIILKQLSTF